MNSNLVQEIWKEISTVEDPDLGMGLVDLGLVYDVSVDEDAHCHIKMTLTSMACPMGPVLKSSVEEAARRVDGVKDAAVEIVWSPPWDPKEMASEEAQMQLGIY